MKRLALLAIIALVSVSVHAQKAASLKDQALCDTQAHKRAAEQKEKFDNSSVNYSSHFDPATRVCYALTEITTLDLKSHQRYVTTEVSDAFERKGYALMFMTYGTGAPDNPSTCYVSPRGTQGFNPAFKCKTESEFRRQVAKYFGL
jgi:hypothetical protein